jgi:hypothetical protein
LFDGELLFELGHSAVHIAELLALDFHFGEDNFPFMTFFLHFMALLSAGLLGLSMLLPFEANFSLSLFGSQL